MSREVASTKPPGRSSPTACPRTSAASVRPSIAARRRVPRRSSCRLLLQEAQAASLDGPSLADRGRVPRLRPADRARMALIDAAVEQIEHGSPVTARFARENVALYIESVYDAHFTLAQSRQETARPATASSVDRLRSGGRCLRAKWTPGEHLLRSKRSAAPACRSATGVLNGGSGNTHVVHSRGRLEIREEQPDLALPGVPSSLTERLAIAQARRPRGPRSRDSR